MDTTADIGRRKRRALVVAGNALLAAALLVATWPWTSGAYTWLVQRGLGAELAADARGTRARGRAAAKPETRVTDTGDAANATPAAASAEESAGAGVWRGWEREDALAWARARDGDGVGKLRVPKLGLDVVLVKGAHDAELRRGPGWVVGTSVPGPQGNVGVSGHRTTYLAPFRDIDRLDPGDVVRIDTRWRVYTYRVTQRMFADRDDVSWLFATREPTLTLTSCHPPYSDRFRILVSARLVGVVRR